MTIKSFIDTNVFVHWIILSKIKQEKPDDKQLWTRFRKIKPSYQFLDKIKNTQFNQDFEFFTSSLSISEIFYSLLDEYRCRLMLKDGVPLSSWQTTKTRFNLDKEQRKEVTDDIINFLNEFEIFIQLSPSKKISLISEEHINYNIFSNLVLERNFRTHDAVLIVSAFLHGCKYFVTEDRLMLENKIPEIEAIHPEKMLQLLNG